MLSNPKDVGRGVIASINSLIPFKVDREREV